MDPSVNPFPGGWSLVSSANVLVVVGSFVMALILLALTAAFFFHWRNTRRAALWNVREAIWNPAIMAYLFKELGAESVIGLVDPGEEVAFVEHILKLSQHLKGWERRHLDKLASGYLKPIVEYAEHRDPEQRAKAVQILGELGMPAYRGELMVALEDPVPFVAFTAAKALLYNEPGESVAAILGNLHRFEESSPFYMAGLLASAGAATVPHLRAFLVEKRNSGELRAIAARALLLIRDPGAAALAAEQLARGVDRELALSCLDILRAVGEPSQAGAIRALFPIEDDDLLAKALAALGQIGNADDRQLIAAQMAHSSAWVALAAARSLRDLGDNDLLEEYSKGESVHHELAWEILEEAVS